MESKKFLALTISLVMMCTTFAACGRNENDTAISPETSGTVSEEKIQTH